ncbi:TolC family protein [Pseudodesulfovibrio pelocollis]|uniref:TolC family protein n=1 Tax=Pseudodesulfovibrio pelocollis TaxID=3051432 RepID=UPI00255A8CED|nr:TolC family protein [Pseudodesulfovibrio sp. SB368]
MALVCLFLSIAPAAAQQERNLDINALLRELVQTHDRVKAAEAQYEAVKHQYKRAQGGWYPKVDAKAEGGRENLTKPLETETQMNRNMQKLTATQRLYDFGATTGTIDSAAGRVMEYEALLDRTKQVVIASGITAYLRVVRSRELLKYARRSEQSMIELSGMQEVLVQRGAGYSYEELQVKGQLAGAQSYRVTQEREVQISINNFKSVFGFTPTQEEVDRMNAIPLPRQFIPATLEEAVEVAFDTNPVLLETAYTMDRLQGDLKAQEATYYPRFDAVLEGERKENDQGSTGVRSEQRASLMMTYNIFSGFQDAEAIRSIKSEMTGANRTLLDRRRTVEESVRNAWLELTTLRQNSELYENQANITWEFLGLVKKKKAMGEDVRLLDILVGERDYISSISAKVATDIDIIIAAYTLLYEMGVITEDTTRM